MSEQVASCESEQQVQVVDSNGTIKGTIGKLEAHRKGQLHLAFSVMLVRKVAEHYECLLQRRAPNKYHSGGLWSNSCCSHPKPGEALEDAVQRRLIEELNYENTEPLIYLGSLVYRLELDNELVEHEFDHIYLSTAHEAPKSLNFDEVSEIRWCKLEDLKAELSAYPSRFTKWLPLIVDRIIESHALSEH